MKCPRCQAPNDDRARFCEDCGARLELVCPVCGQPVGAGKNFCRSCGAPLTEPSRFASPQAYTPKHLAEKILTSKGALEGERKQVTVLFADMKGSMELLVDRDPEEARTLLDPVLERMMEAVHRYEGTVNQVMGDGIMALFGAPLAHEDHAVRACYAALRMQESIKSYAEDLRRTHGMPVRIRVGLNSGAVLVRSIGSDLRIDYTAVGQTTHLAARVEQLAEPGSVLVTGETLKLAEGYVEAKPLGPVSVKGVGEPVDVYEITGAGPVRTRLQALATRELSPFVGRDAEMAQLRQALAKAGDGHGQVVALVGEPGVGKSRLYWELTHGNGAQGWLVVEGGAVSYGKATAYLPVSDLLRGYFQIELGDEARNIREKVSARLRGLDPALEPCLPALLSLVDVPVEDAPWQTLDPVQRRQRTMEALKLLLLRESQEQPLLMVLEDLQWIDTETQAFLDSLIESLPSARILLLVDYRPEYQHGWANKTYYTQLRIDPLPLQNASELLRTLLGADAHLDRLKRRLIEQTEGNPFFLEESVRSLIETRVLVGGPGAYRPSKSLEDVQVPATVQAVLAARIDRLPPEYKRLLQSAAVVGKDVPLTILEAIAELPAPDLHSGLGHLQASEFLYETRLFPAREYTFKHALTHEMTYGSLVRDRRRALHARIVEAIEQLYSDRLIEQLERLANHTFQGEVWEKAVAYLRQAGAKASARGANREAVAFLEQALIALQHLPERRETIEQAIDIRFDLRNSLLLVGEFGRTLEYLREAETLAQALGDQYRLADVSANMTHYFRLVGDHDHATQFGHRALALAKALGDLTLRVKTNLVLGQTYLALGDYGRAIGFFRDCMAAVGGDRVRERFGQPALPAVVSRTYLVWALAERGEFGEGIARGEEVIRIAESVDHPYSRVFAYFAVGGLYLRQGDFDKAIPVLEHGLVLCQSMNFPILFPTVASHLGYARALSGKSGQALPLLEQAVEQGESMRLLFGRSLRVAWLGEAYLLAGRSDEAIDLAHRAVDLLDSDKERGHRAYLLRFLGEIGTATSPKDLTRAEGHYRDALALADELGMRPLVAHCHLGLGKLYRRTGDRPKAEEHFTTAAKIFQGLQMRFWLQKTQQAGLSDP